MTITEELEAREQSVVVFAEGIGLELEAVTALISGESPLTDQLAEKIGAFFGTSAGFWKGLEAEYQSGLKRREEKVSVKTASGNLAIRVPKTLHARVLEVAKREGVSMNQVLVAIISEGVGKHEMRLNG